MPRRLVIATVAALVLIAVSVIFLVPSDGQKVAKQPQQQVAQLQQTTPPPATPQMIFNDIWDNVNNRLMTTPWAGAQGTSQSETYILNDVWDEAGHFLRVSSSGSGGGAGLPFDPVACTAGRFVIDQDINGILTCAQVAFSNLTGVATDAQIPDLNTLSTGLTPSRCVETNSSGTLVSAAALCGSGSGGLPADPIPCPVNQFVTDQNASGVLTCAQPSSSTLSDASAVVKTTTPQQLSNKQHIPREVTMVPVANAITPDCDAADVVVVNAISATLTVNAPTCVLPGNPVPSQEIDFRFFCSAHQQIFWNGVFSTTAGVPYLSDCTGDGTTFDYAKVRRNSVNSKWEFVATKAAGKGITTVASGTSLPCDAGISTQCIMRNTAGAGTGIAISNPGGSPVDGQLMMWIVRCTAAQTITYGAKFIDSPNITKPTSCSTDAQKYTMLGARYSLLDDLWQVIASN